MQAGVSSGVICGLVLERFFVRRGRKFVRPIPLTSHCRVGRRNFQGRLRQAVKPRIRVAVGVTSMGGICEPEVVAGRVGCACGPGAGQIGLDVLAAELLG